jgi:periplasmic protein TonB
VFNRLPESNAPRQRRAGGAVVSTVVHFVFIALAVRATGLRATPAPDVMRVEPPVYIENRKTDDPPPPRSAGPTSSIRPAGHVFRPVTPTIDLTHMGIPDVGDVAVDLSRPGDFDPTAAIISTGGSGGTPNVSGGTPLPERLVDEPVLALPGTATPRYPSMLQSAGVEGDVRAQFVVDTLGRVEPGSVRVLDTTHDLFASAVRDALNRARFTAAKAGGRKVRQLAEQVFTFRITK